MSSLASSISTAPTDVGQGEPSTRDRRMPSVSSLPAQLLRRPALGRSFSSATHPRASATNTLHAALPSSPLAHHQNPKHHDWSLFRQMMANESVLDAGPGRTESPDQAPPLVEVPTQDDLCDDEAPRIRWACPPRVPAIPLLWKNMLKCSVAYFIGSLFTFHPELSRFFGDLTSSYQSGAGGPYPSAHLIATMCVHTRPVFCMR